MRSRVTENCWPTSSSVWSVFMPMPKRMRSTRSSRGVSEASTRVVVSRKFDWIAASIGRIAFLSSMKSPRCESSSSPIGVSSEIGSLAIFKTLRTFSSGIAGFALALLHHVDDLAEFLDFQAGLGRERMNLGAQLLDVILLPADEFAPAARAEL